MYGRLDVDVAHGCLRVENPGCNHRYDTISPRMRTGLQHTPGPLAWIYTTQAHYCMLREDSADKMEIAQCRWK